MTSQCGKSMSFLFDREAWNVELRSCREGGCRELLEGQDSLLDVLNKVALSWMSLARTIQLS